MNRLIGDLVDVTSIDAGKLAVEAAEGPREGAISVGVLEAEGTPENAGRHGLSRGGHVQLVFAEGASWLTTRPAVGRPTRRRGTPAPHPA
jgi:hypothetical protein